MTCDIAQGSVHSGPLKSAAQTDGYWIPTQPSLWQAALVDARSNTWIPEISIVAAVQVTVFWLRSAQDDRPQVDLEKRQLELKGLELERRRQKDEWNRLVQIAKGIGWVIDRTKEE